MAGYIITNEKEANEAIREILIEEYQKNANSWMEEIEDVSSISSKEFIQVMDNLFKDVAQKQENAGKRTIEKIYIHYLHSSQLDGTFELMINAYTKAVYFDICETEVYWCPTKVKKYYFDAIEHLRKQIKRKNILISEKKIREIERKFYFDYMIFFPKFFNKMMPKVMELDSFKKCDIAKDLLVVFGEYMGKIRPVFIHFSDETIAEFIKQSEEYEEDNEVLHD